MSANATVVSRAPSSEELTHLDAAALVEHAAHLLPSQGPVTVFVHHNTLHMFEDFPFDTAVKAGVRRYGCNPYLPEPRYREKLAEGRILPADLERVLHADLGEAADELIGLVGTRFHLRLAMLAHPLLTGEDAELRWLVDETDTLVRFRPGTDALLRARAIGETRQWALGEFGNGSFDEHLRDMVDDLVSRYGGRVERWGDDTWEEFTLQFLWRVCHQGVHGVRRFEAADEPPVRHRDVLLQATGEDVDGLVDPPLIRFCASFLDQGFAQWDLPLREEGFLKSFLALHRDGRPVDRWLRRLPAEIRRIEAAGLDAAGMIDESLDRLGVPEREREEYLVRTLLALRGWAGMIWQMETNAEWTVRPAPRGTLVEYVAVRLLLERLAIAHHLEEAGESTDLAHLRSVLGKRVPHRARVSVGERAHLVFQLAQVRGWSPLELHRMTKAEWSRLVEEIEAFPTVERSRVYHLAYERRYRVEALDAVIAHASRQPVEPVRPRAAFQTFHCIDDREESFRRHLEEVAPECETCAAAGFYAVAMYYRGAGGAHFTPLAPAIVKPRHYVLEEVAYVFEQEHRRRSRTRRVLGTASHRFHMGSRTILGGIGAALSGSLATCPLVMRTLFPGIASRLHRTFRGFVDPPLVTQLRLERTEEEPGAHEGHVGYSLDEMANVVERILRDIAVAPRLAPLVIVLGHGSSSLNNPHESAYNCGACSGGRGGPNARALAQMANDLRVRERLAARGLTIPADTYFVGGLHNTCNDGVTYFELERLPPSHREAFRRAREKIDRARERDAHERCRRFDSAPLDLTPEQALRHVEERAEDLSQARPEYNHATNALCIVGRRATTRGLFLDRRAFLNCYDATTDDENARILERILQAAIPVCAGISLEYYFSTVDVQGYGSGSKLPHNIVSLLGVMEGAASDLRTGLSAQMVEIHEPVRVLFVIETTPQLMLGIMTRNPAIDRLVRNAWVQLATLDPHDRRVHVFERGTFEAYVPESRRLPTVASSAEWYGGRRDHLGFASIVEESPEPVDGRVRP
jgi:uncharacterized protein